MRRHQGAKVEHFDVSNVIYHKFSHGGVSYMLNGKNVNAMLELYIHYFVAGKNLIVASAVCCYFCVLYVDITYSKRKKPQYCDSPETKSL